MLQNSYPILEYDETRQALLNPEALLPRLDDMPQHVVLCFFQEVIARVCHDAPVIYKLGSEMGRNPVYALETEHGRVAVAHPGVGAPLAAAFLEELAALGGRKFIACGGSGVLDGALIPVGHVVVPESAVRDEGTSYHYLPPARECQPTAAAVAAIKATLERHHVPWLAGKTWTTDAFYRETPARIARRRDEGCLTVEMEAAAFFAVAQFRGLVFGQILYGGDDVSGEEWDGRNWVHGRADTREKLFWLAAEAVLAL